MSANEIIKQAINLKPQERYQIIETLIQSLDEVDSDIEKLWIKESQNRLDLYDEGKLETVSFEEVFDK
ncbi:MAG: addiction module protein [Campylobacterota bacterium]|nr:addiction module protein [Campylobacterota bacterium]